MDVIDKNFVTLAHRLILGYLPSDSVVEHLVREAGSIEKLGAFGQIFDLGR